MQLLLGHPCDLLRRSRMLSGFLALLAPCLRFLVLLGGRSLLGVGSLAAITRTVPATLVAPDIASVHRDIPSAVLADRCELVTHGWIPQQGLGSLCLYVCCLSQLQTNRARSVPASDSLSFLIRNCHYCGFLAPSRRAICKMHGAECNVSKRHVSLRHTLESIRRSTSARIVNTVQGTC